MEIRISELAALAEDREFSVQLEEGYHRSTHQNPVESAIKWLHAYKKSKWLLQQARNCSIVLMIILIAFLVHGFKNLISLEAFAVSIPLGLYIILLLMQAKFIDGHKADLLEQEVEPFLKDLNALISWSSELTTRSQLLKTFGDTHRKNVSSKILIAKAKEVLKVQEGGPYKNLKDEAHRMLEQASHMDELKRRYDILQRFGIVSGGYKKYFETAKREVREADAAITRELAKSDDGRPFGMPG